MKKIFRPALAACCAVLLLAPACQPEQKNYKANLYAMGTLATLAVADRDGNGYSAAKDGLNGGAVAFTALKEEAGALLTGVENSISPFIAGTSVYRFNRAQAGERVEIDKTAYDVFSLALELYGETEGYYNPAVYHSVQSYGFPVTGDDPTTLPPEQSAEEFSKLAQAFGGLQLTQLNGAYYATKPQTTVTVEGMEYDLSLDFGGLGKGWCADAVGSLLEQKGYSYGYFSFTSSSASLKEYAYGNDGYYSVNLIDPRVAGGRFATVKAKNLNFSTSGDYEQYYVIDGTRYCHIINPFTGKPIQTGVASVTVIGGSAAEDDALTTALSCMGLEKAVEFINRKLADRTVVMLIFVDGEGKIVTNRPQDVQITNGDYKLFNTVEGGKIKLNDVG